MSSINRRAHSNWIIQLTTSASILHEIHVRGTAASVERAARGLLCADKTATTAALYFESTEHNAYRYFEKKHGGLRIVTLDYSHVPPRTYSSFVPTKERP